MSKWVDRLFGEPKDAYEWWRKQSDWGVIAIWVSVAFVIAVLWVSHD